MKLHIPPLQTWLQFLLSLPLYQKICSGLSVVALVILIYGFASLFTGSQSSETSSGTEVAASPNLGHVTVNIAGAVTNPGIYTLMIGDRIAQGIDAAGGVNAEADQTQLAQTYNLAEPLSDGEKIEVPAIGETSIDASVSASATSTPIDLNHASEAQLDSLPGIGATRAQAIIAHRPYTSADDIVAKGVLGQAVWDQIKDKVSH